MANETIAYKAGKGILSIPKKAVYGVLGNFSDSVQQRIRKISGGRYSPSEATRTSANLNVLLYGLGAAATELRYGPIARTVSAFIENATDPSAHMSVDYPACLLGATLAGLIYGAFERGFRTQDACKTDKVDVGAGSIPGKIVSMPLEGLEGLVDGVKEAVSKKPVAPKPTQ